LNKRTKYLLNNPYNNLTYNESKIIIIQDKLSWLAIHEPLYISFIVDKIKLHYYSKKILGKDICMPILKIYDDFNKINFSDLPDKIAMKYNHGSGMNIICEDKV